MVLNGPPYGPLGYKEWDMTDATSAKFCHSFSSQEQVPFNFMVAVTICSDFGAQENKICCAFTFYPSSCNDVMGLGVIIIFFLMLSFKSGFSLLFLTIIKELFIETSLSAIIVLSFLYLRLLVFRQPYFQFVIHSARHFSVCTLPIS